MNKVLIDPGCFTEHWTGPDWASPDPNREMEYEYREAVLLGDYLSVRAQGVLARSGYKTWSDLNSLELLSMKNCGTTTLRCIKKWAEGYGHPFT